MRKYKLSSRDKNIIEIRLSNKYKTIGSLKVISVQVHQIETTNKDILTTVEFHYGFISQNTISFVYFNDELFSVAGSDVKMNFIEEMKNLLKEYNK